MTSYIVDFAGLVTLLIRLNNRSVELHINFVIWLAI